MAATPHQLPLVLRIFAVVFAAAMVGAYVYAAQLRARPVAQVAPQGQAPVESVSVAGATPAPIVLPGLTAIAEEAQVEANLNRVMAGSSKSLTTLTTIFTPRDHLAVPGLARAPESPVATPTPPPVTLSLSPQSRRMSVAPSSKSGVLVDVFTLPAPNPTTLAPLQPMATEPLSLQPAPLVPGLSLSTPAPLQK
jgi:hypothetical protein